MKKLYVTHSECFEDCTNFKAADPDYPSLANYNRDEFTIEGTVLKKYKGWAKTATVPWGVTTIGVSAFNGSYTLNEIVLPGTVTTIGNNAFTECASLKNITLPDSLTSIDYAAFIWCSSLESVTIPNSVQFIGGSAFGKCKSLTIYCEAAAESTNWATNWNPDNRPIVWGYKKTSATNNNEASEKVVAVPQNEEDNEFNVLNPLIQKYGRLVMFDTETTGLSAENDNIIEFGAIAFTIGANGKLLVEKEGFYVKYHKPLPAQIVSLTGISNSILQQKGLDRSEAERKIIDFLYKQKSVICAYNAQFDLSFIRTLLKKQNKVSLLSTCRYIDVMTIYKDRAAYPHKLANAILTYGITQARMHDAVDDAISAIRVLCKMITEKNDIENYFNLFGYNARYGVNGNRLDVIHYAPQAFNTRLPLYDMDDNGEKARKKIEYPTQQYVSRYEPDNYGEDNDDIYEESDCDEDFYDDQSYTLDDYRRDAFPDGPEGDDAFQQWLDDLDD